MKVHHVGEHRGAFFKVLGGTSLSQVAVMTIEPGADSGPEEIHSGDQLVYVIEGEAEVAVNQEEANMCPGDLVTIPQGAQHNIRNTGAVPLFFLTVYAPPQY